MVTSPKIIWIVGYDTIIVVVLIVFSLFNIYKLTHTHTHTHTHIYIQHK